MFNDILKNVAYSTLADRRLIEKITVCEDKFTVEFKSGVAVDLKGLVKCIY